MDIKKIVASLRKELVAATNPGAPNCRYWQAYEMTRVAVAGLPHREATITYVLGVMAGCEFDHTKMFPSAPFREGSKEGRDFAQGFLDAQEVISSTRAAMPLLGDIINEMFGGQ